MESSPAFTPFRIGQLELSGRIIKTATEETRGSGDAKVTESLLAFYRPIAAAKTPLIITGNMHIVAEGQSSPNACGIDDDTQLPGLQRLTDEIHRLGSKVFVQLNHCGRQVLLPSVRRDRAWSASGVKEKILGTKPEPLTPHEITALVAAFGAAAKRAQQAGFDGVQIHAAHGYLISQFLTPYTNRRTDAYGGNFENRLRFLREVYRAVRAAVGPNYPVILKLNGHDQLWLRNGLSTTTLIDIARAMEQEGVDAIEISVGHYESGLPMVRGYFAEYFTHLFRGGAGPQLPWLIRTAMRLFRPILIPLFNLLWSYKPGFNVKYARRFKQALKIPVICVGGFADLADIEHALQQGHCDAVSAGRAFIANPLLYRTLQTQESAPRCNYCNACVGSIGGVPVDCYNAEIRPLKDELLRRAGLAN
jgi:2,4-dienoyl-CoA reductase-like NADH-dependent reductase (Old Yellow Enzyme family)